MLAWLGPPKSARRRARYQVVFAAGIGVLALVAAAAAFILYSHYGAAISSYESSPACSSPGDALQGKHCRFSGQAQVLTTTRTDRLNVKVEFYSIPGHTFSTGFTKDSEPSAAALTTGTTTDGELWSGKVTRLAGKLTTDNPESTPAQPLLTFGVIFVLGALLIFGLDIGLAMVNLRVK